MCKRNSGDYAHEHERRARHCVQEKLCRRIDALVIAPTTDQEIHRHQNDFEHDKKQEQVEREKRTHDAGLQQQHPRQVRSFIVVRIDTDDHQRKQDAGEHDQEQRDAVDTEVP